MGQRLGQLDFVFLKSALLLETDANDSGNTSGDQHWDKENRPDTQSLKMFFEQQQGRFGMAVFHYSMPDRVRIRPNTRPRALLVNILQHRMLARAEYFAPHRVALGKHRDSCRRMHRILPRLKSAVLDYGHEIKPAAVFIPFPRAHTIRSGLLYDGSQHMLQQSVWIGFLGQRVQRVSEGVQLTAGQAFRGAQRLRRSLAFCDVAQDDSENQFAAEIQFGNGCLGRKLVSVLANAEQFTTLAHGSRNVRRFGERLDVSPVGVSKSLGQQHVKRLADDFVFTISKHFLGALIEQEDALVGINRDNRVFGDCKNTLEPGFAPKQGLFCTLTLDRDSRKVCHLLDEVQLLRTGTARFAGIKRECPYYVACGGKYGRGPACPQPMVDG